jgi:MraZ protein
MSIFRGRYTVSLDPTGRLAIPAKVRNAFPDGDNEKIFITRGVSHCIEGYPLSIWAKREAKFNKAKINEKYKQILIHTYSSHAAEELFDKQGRITIPDNLIEWARLEDCTEVTIIGTMKHIEIWNPRLCKEVETENEAIFQDIMANFVIDDDDEEKSDMASNAKSDGKEQ